MIIYMRKPDKRNQKNAIQWLIDNCEMELESGDIVSICKNIVSKAAEDYMDIRI